VSVGTERGWVGRIAVPQTGFPCGTTLVSIVSVGTFVSDVSIGTFVSIVSVGTLVSDVSVGTLVSIVSVLKKTYPESCKDRKGRIANMPPVLCWRGLADMPPACRAQALRVPAPQKTSLLAAIASRTLYGSACHARV
jgi:hypothetical protein